MVDFTKKLFSYTHVSFLPGLSLNYWLSNMIVQVSYHGFPKWTAKADVTPPQIHYFMPHEKDKPDFTTGM